MKKKVSVRHLTAILFVILLMVNFLLGLYPFALGTFRMLRGLANGEDLDVSTIEYTFNDSFPTKGLLITANGGIQRLLGARYLNNRYLLDNGHLTYTIAPYDTTQVARNTAEFSRMLEERGIPLVYVNAPFKIYGKDPQLPVGVSDHSNENADQFVSLLRQQDVQVLDLRECIEAEGLDHYSLFYKTDHHWTAETGLWAVGKITDYLQEMEEAFAVDSRITDPSGYTHTVHKEIFLGSAGRRVGPWFAGMDDLTVIEPGFDTSLRFYSESAGVDRRGTYSQTVLFPENLTSSNIFETAAYDVYCGQNYAELRVRNNSREQGLAVQSTPRRVLMFTDSFSAVLIPFLSLSYDELCFIDLRYYEGAVSDLVEEFRPDAVLVAYNIGALEESNSNMFAFQK